jgi:hypothetical protein
MMVTAVFDYLVRHPEMRLLGVIDRELSGMSHVFLQAGHSPQRPDWLAGVRGLELGNPRTSHVFEIL